jgi:uncharacterized membrane protein
MTTFSVWKFDDHAVVSWPRGASHPDTKHGHEETWHGAAWGSIFGLMIGTLFFMPIAGGLAGAALGGLAKATEDTGITKDQLEKIHREVTEGTSALFVVTEQANLDRLGDRMRGMHSTLLTTNLTDAERDMLLETFGG